MKLKAIFLIGTLKPKTVLSHTYVLSEFLAEKLNNYEVESRFVRLIDYNIQPGVYIELDNDDWPLVYQWILESDIIIFATPIWWDSKSSLLQRVIERLDEVHDFYMKKGEIVLGNKVAGVLVTGDSDGAMHILGNILNFCQWIGLTTVPFGGLTVLSQRLAKESKIARKELWDLYEKEYSAYAQTMAGNLATTAKMFSKRP